MQDFGIIKVKRRNPLLDIAPSLNLGDLLGDDAFTTFLLHCDGSDASTTFTDSSASAISVTANGNAQIDTADSKFGGASALFDGNGDFLSFNGTASAFSLSGDFTVDYWMKSSTFSLQNSIQRRIMSFGTGNMAMFLDDADGSMEIALEAGSVIKSGSTNVADGTWRHIAWTRSGSTNRLFVNGVQEGATFSNSTSWTATNPAYIGRYINSDAGAYSGWIDEFRISKGIARWTANFSPPDRAYLS